MIVNTSFIRRDMGNIQIRGTFICGINMCFFFYKKWLWNYKITGFTVFVSGRWWVDVKLWTFAEGDGGYQNETSANKGGGEFPEFGNFVRT